MKKLLFTVLLCNLSFWCLAQSDEIAIKKIASKIDDFVPANWKIIAEQKGDLNKDGLQDVALIIENTDPKNFISNADRLGRDTLNINPRTLIVLFKQANGKYCLSSKNESFIPSENDEENTCLADPISETGGIEIKKGVLKISFQYWLSCGSYGVNTNSYTFRCQNQKFQLIGADEYYYIRASGEETSTSFNFSTNRMSETKGGNIFKEEENKPKTKFKKIPAKKLLDLATITTEAVDVFSY